MRELGLITIKTLVQQTPEEVVFEFWDKALHLPLVLHSPPLKEPYTRVLLDRLGAREQKRIAGVGSFLNRSYDGGGQVQYRPTGRCQKKQAACVVCHGES